MENELSVSKSTATRTRLFLIRHGESTTNRQGVISGWSTDSVLTELGRHQATLTAGRLQQLPIDALYASPLPRAWETAEIIGHALGLRPIRVDDLREINVGTAVGRPLVDLTSLYPQLQSQFDETGIHTQWPEGESQAQLRGRALRAVDKIVRNHPGETVAAVAHGGPLAWITTTLVGDGAATFRDWRHQNCAITELLVTPAPDGVIAELVGFNDCAHLTDL